MKKNILVFPCGSEIGLEINRSLKGSTHFSVIGANSVEDHGRFVFEHYIGDVPFVSDPDFIPHISTIVKKYNIDAIYPATDKTIAYLKRNEKEIGCRVISPCIETVEICLSKKKTYTFLKGIVSIPIIFDTLDCVHCFPVFGKLDVSHSAIGAERIDSRQALESYYSKNPNCIICEYLSGEEYTVDCFTSNDGKLLFYGVRRRTRIRNGISVRTEPYDDQNNEFKHLIERINSAVSFQGAWFAQFKRNSKGELCLLEIACRFGGSSALFRPLGINFALLTLFDAFGQKVTIVQNKFHIEMDRSLDIVYKTDIHYSEVFVDFDDCLCYDNGDVNTVLVSFLFQCHNKRKKLTLLTHHDNTIHESLRKICLENLFDRVIQIDKSSNKIDFIDNHDSIFIDDSFAERQAVANAYSIPVFGLDSIISLMQP